MRSQVWWEERIYIIYMYVCGCVTLRNVNEMRNVISVRNAQCDKHKHACSSHLNYYNGRRRGQSEMSSYPEEDEAEGKDDGRKLSERAPDVDKTSSCCRGM